jgi:predicted phosphoribosyltransferase
MGQALFHDRREAGQRLAARLAPWRDYPSVIVLGIPRGGVIVAAEVARALHSPLDIWLTRKLGAPGEPELAIGAIASDGTMVLDEQLIRSLKVPGKFIEQVRDRELGEIRRRMELFRQGRPSPDLQNRVLILCDDGVATGATTITALRALKKSSPARLILAVPVAPASIVPALERECDELVILATPDPFLAVGRFYAEFDQTTDEQVIAGLNESTRRAVS